MVDNLFSRSKYSNRLHNGKIVDGNRNRHEIRGRIGLELD